ncbi:NOX5 oxidase, partial [Chaetorhynchus papuensis]|nr:NOX5 oxidase [Chaetorhynchus papuensis]
FRDGSVCWAGSRAMGAAADAEWLRWVTKQFGNIAGKEREISLEEFKSALQVKESFFAERFFALFDSDGSGSLSLEELLGSLRLLLHGNPTEKLRFLFRVYDVDGERRESGSRLVFQEKFGICCTLSILLGSIDAEELRVVLRECLRESSMALPEERLGALSQALLQAADQDHSGSITFPELQEQLEAFPEILENLSISTASWLRPPAPTERRLWPRCFSREFWRQRPRCFSRELRGARLGCLGAWAAVTALLLALGALRHRERGPALALARGCGHGLNLNCALLAALMLRRSLTRLRSTPLAELLPLELHVRGHELVGYLVLALAAAHSAAHLAHRGLAQGPGQVTLGEFLRRARPGSGGVAGTAPQTGLALLALLLAMLVCSCPCVRRGGHFEVFYWSHLSYISVWLLLLLHGPHFWKWFLIPGSLFFLEKVLGWAWRWAGDLRILEANLLPSKVTHLVIQRPKSFRFQPGDYVFLNIPAIAAYEWHPFSISSAPEQPETLWLHIRALGQWTNKLYEYFQQLELCGPEPDPPRKSRREWRSWEQVSGIGIRAGDSSSWMPSASHGIIPCFLDGPYGTPSGRIFRSEHAVLIGAGIGITPLASILQSIMFRYRQRKRSCPSCGFSWCEERQDEMTLRKVDFIWITRDQQHLEWFLSLLSKLETEQAELEPGGKFLELHLYMTSALAKGDVKALGLQVALDLLAAKENRDSITGLRTRTQPGRPDWAKVFGKVAAERRGKVRVFFCGSPGLAGVIRGHCRTFGFRFSKENF